MIKLKCFQKDNDSTIALLIRKALIIRCIENLRGKVENVNKKTSPQWKVKSWRNNKTADIQRINIKYRECDQRLNYRPLYTIYTDSQSVTRSVLESRTRKQERTNKNTTAYCVENQRFAEAKPPFPTTAQTLFLHCVHI